jgi:hypothetical protein
VYVQIDSNAAVMPVGSPGTGIVATTSFVAGSIRETEFPWWLPTHTDPNATSAYPGCSPTFTIAAT